MAEEFGKHQGRPFLCAVLIHKACANVLLAALINERCVTQLVDNKETNTAMCPYNLGTPDCRVNKMIPHLVDMSQ